MMVLKFENFTGKKKNSFSPYNEEITNAENEFNDDLCLPSFCRDLYHAYKKETGREGRIITNFEEFYFYNLFKDK